MPSDEEESTDVVFMSYPFGFASFLRSKELESSLPPPVVIVAWTWSGSRSDS